MKNYFITGTDTGVGKTFVTAALLSGLQARGLRVAPMKPVAAGTIEINGRHINDDVALLQEISQQHFALTDVNPYCLAEPIAPHIAAARENVCIDITVIADAFARLAANADSVLVEGAGGFLVPLSSPQSMAEIPRALKLDVIMVVAMRLGCLNHALLTAEAVRARGLHLAGWVANSISATQMSAFDENLASLKLMLNAPCLGVLPHMITSGAGYATAAATLAALHLRLDNLA